MRVDEACRMVSMTMTRTMTSTSTSTSTKETPWDGYLFSNAAGRWWILE